MKKQNVIKSSFLEAKKKKEEGIPDAFSSFNSVKDNKIEKESKKEKKDDFEIFKDNKKEKDEQKTEEKSKNNPFAMFNSNVAKDSKKEEKVKDKDDFFEQIDERIEVEKKESKSNIFEKEEKKGGFFGSKKTEKPKEEAKGVFFDDVDKSDSSKPQQDFSKLKKEKPNIKVNINLPKINLKDSGRALFNITCLIIFIIMMVFVYFKWLRVDTYEELTGLRYRVPPTFKLKQSEANSKYYESTEYNNACSIRLLVGPAADPDGYVESYFRYVKSLYADDNLAVFNLMEMSINGQKWKNEKVVFIPADDPEVDSTKIIPRYSYTIMTYNGMFYSITYVNINEKKDCNEELTNFMNSVEFKESNVK